MANKRNQKHKKGLGQHTKKISKGSGHLRGYLYYKIMVFSWQPILFSSQYLSEGCFIGFWGTLNSNLTMKLRTGYLRDNLYLKILVFSCRPILFESCDSYESGFRGFRGRWIRIWHRKMSMSSPWLPILWQNIIFHHKKAQKKPDSAKEREIETNEEDIEGQNNFDWYFNRNRIIEPGNIDKTLAAEAEIEQEKVQTRFWSTRGALSSIFVLSTPFIFEKLR